MYSRLSRPQNPIYYSGSGLAFGKQINWIYLFSILPLLNCTEPSPPAEIVQPSRQGNEIAAPPLNFQADDSLFPWDESFQYNILIDPRDSLRYRTILIGDQNWMAENLRFQAHRSWCYMDDNDSCRRYGRLYNWTTAMGIDSEFANRLWHGFDYQIQGVCPSGWHLPSDSEWDSLISFVESDPRVGQNNSGSALKFAPDPWARTAPPGFFSPTAGKDYFGFRILPGGSRWADTALYAGIGTNARFWSSTEGYELAAYGRAIYEKSTSLNRHGGNKASGFSVRCIQN